MTFTVNTHDLQFILQQIKLSEAHSRAISLGQDPGDALRALVAGAGGGQQAHLLPFGVRTVDGTYNNLIPGRETWGAADQPFPFITTRTYGDDQDGDQQPLGPPGGPVVTNTNYGNSGNVADADPRIISNLIADQSSNNPVAVMVRDNLIARGYEVPETPMLDQQGNPVLDGSGNPVMVYTFVNIAPDAGLSAPYNSLLTIFGQFFDHGLDLVAKGGNGKVYIPLQPDDPLYDPAHPERNFMVLTRQTPDADNGVTPFVDQNQTYTSHASHQVFLREYVRHEGKTISTGDLLDGDRGLPTWADIKNNAREFLGINLTDADVNGVPLLRTDLYGNLILDANGFAQVITGIGADLIPNTADDTVISGTDTAPVSLANAVRVGVAFLNDIAHDADPYTSSGALLGQDTDSALGLSEPNNPQTGQRVAFDNELLNEHYVTGDGRGNENIALSAFHNMFHSEHNRIVAENKTTILASGDLTFINEWLLTPIAALPQNQAEIDALVWNGERLFQAGRFSTEMQYQHLVFEEFARTVQPDIDLFVFEPSADINPAIFGEFAHAVYRLGHSMLNEDIPMVLPDGTQTSMRLFDAFLNPLAFGEETGDTSGNVTIGHDAAGAAIVRGLSAQAGNEVDEFTTHVLRNQLVGIPLDLAALNIARGRDVGLPSLNEARRQFFEASNQDTNLKPYESWADYGLNMKNPESIINFIAAYGTHSSITGATTLEAKRAAAMDIVLGGPNQPVDAIDFLHSTGEWATKESGLNLVDLWIGGLAEQQMINGGLLGSTFAFVFEVQMENLQDGDRFYYLSRTQGLNMLNELENNSIGEMFRTNSHGALDGVALPGHLFTTPAHILYLDPTQQLTPDPVDSSAIRNALNPMVRRVDTDNDGDFDRIVYRGDEHIVIGGTNEDDHLVSGLGDDTVWGFGGNDRIEVGYGVDVAHGGDGDDIITNAGTDIGATDFLHGEKGNDAIHGGPGLALIFGNEGNDFIITGPDGKEAFGGTGNDFILGGDGTDVLLGNEGDDWLEGGARFDGLAGENSELFFNSTIVGHDIMNGGGNDTDYDGESGDDIMFINEGIQRANGMAGFDWAIGKGFNQGIEINLGLPVFNAQEAFILRDRMDLVEGASGWKYNDTIIGRAFALGAADGGIIVGGVASALPGTYSSIESFSNALLEKHVGLIAGLAELTAHRTRFDITFDGDGPGGKPAQVEQAVMDTDNGEDILLGGGGSDTLMGLAGDDIISGDQWLNVRIQINGPNGENLGSADGMAQKIYLNGVLQFGGKTLDRLIFEGAINPGQLEAKRELLNGGQTGDIDVAVYSDNFNANTVTRIDLDTITDGNYTITRHRDGNGNLDGSYTVAHTGFNPLTAVPPPDGTQPRSDGTDRLFGIENIRFANGEYSLRALLNNNPNGAPIITDLTPQEGVPDTANLGTLVDPDGINMSTVQYQWQQSSDGGLTWTNVAGASSDAFTPADAPGNTQVGDLLRIQVTYTDNAGTVEVAYSGATGEVGDLWTGVDGINNLFIGTAGDDIATGVDPDGNGTGGNDFLQGNGGNDVLVGLGGNDILDGGAGIDTMSGGLGNDTYNVDDALDVINENVNEGIDTVMTSLEEFTIADNFENLTYTGDAGTSFTGTGNAADNIILGGGAADTLIGLEGNDTLDGGLGIDTAIGGLGDDIYIVRETSDVVTEAAGEGTDEVRALANAYTLSANVENLDYIGTGNFNGTGNAEANNISGGDGNDTLSGGGGAAGDGVADTLSGGLGDDTYDVDAVGEEVIVENAGEGSDTIRTSLNSFALTNGVSIENLRFDGVGNFAGTGNDVENIITGNGGDDVLDGGLGIDTLIGGVGNDTYRVDNSGDVVTENAASGNDTVESTANAYTLSGNIETLNFTGTGDFAGTGNAQANTIRGGAGNDVLDGAGGVDTMIGGLGNDSYVVDAAGEVVTELAGEGTDTIRTTLAAYSLAALPNIENLTNIGAGAFNGTGNAANNVMTGNIGVDTLNGGDGDDTLIGGGSNDILNGGNNNDTIDGGAGNDTMNGGAGNDTYFVDVATDNITGETATGGLDTVNVSAAAYTMAGNVENMNYIGAGDFAGTGNGSDNVIVGGAGNDTLNGGGGNDTMEGRGGNNALIGAGGAADAVSYANATSGVNANLTTGTTTVGGNGFGGTDTYATVENLIGSAFADTITGSAAANVLSSGDGADNILAGGGADTVNGGAGNDTINGGGANDIINGGGNDDLIIQLSTEGRDVIDGGAGTDTYQLNGVAGAETFNIYTRAAYALIQPAVVLSANTEIVVTRNGTAAANIVAELDNIEEITVNALNTTANNGNNVTAPDGGASGGDTINVFGNFEAPNTSLDYNTITINGSGARDTVNITGLESAHRIVFNTDGGNDVVIGNLRPQDVVNSPDGFVAGTGTTANPSSGGGTPISQGGGTSGIGATPPATLLAETVMLHGGRGADRLFGTDAAEVLTGGKGRDVFVFGNGDRVSDFKAKKDKIDLSALGVTAENFGSKVQFVKQGRDTLIKIDDHSMLISGTSPAKLKQSVFVFAEAVAATTVAAAIEQQSAAFDVSGINYSVLNDGGRSFKYASDDFDVGKVSALIQTLNAGLIKTAPTQEPVPSVDVSPFFAGIPDFLGQNIDWSGLIGGMVPNLSPLQSPASLTVDQLEMLAPTGASFALSQTPVAPAAVAELPAELQHFVLDDPEHQDFFGDINGGSIF